MEVTTFQGVVENGTIQLGESVKLPENTVVYVVVPNSPDNRIPRIMSPHFANKEDAKLFVKTVEDDVDDDL
jgi:hypothetical protein